MSNRKKPFFGAGLIGAAVIILLSVAGSAAAGTPQVTQPLTLDQAMAVAFQNSPELRVAADQLEKSRGVVDEANSRLKVVAGGKVSYSVADPKPPSQTGPVASFAVSVPIDVTHQLRYAREIADDQSQLQALSARATAARLVLNVKNAYIGLLRAYGRRDVDKAAVAAAEAAVADTKAKEEAGLVPAFDVKTAQVNLANLNQQLIASENQVLVAQAALDRVMGIDVNTPTEVVPLEGPVDTNTIDIPKSVEAAHARRPEVKLAQMSVTLAETNVALQKTGAIPGVTLQGGPSYTFSPRSQNSDGVMWQAGVSVSFPILDGGYVKAKVREAQADVQNSTDALTQAKLTVAQDVRTAALNVQEAAQRTQTTAGAVALAEQALSLANDRYEAGIAVLMEVTNAQSQLTQARFNHVNAQYDYAVAVAQLQWATSAQPELDKLVPASLQISAQP